MAGTIDSAVEKKRDEKQAQGGGSDSKIEHSQGPGEGDSSATKTDKKQATPKSQAEDRD